MRSGRRSTTASEMTGVTVHFVDEGVDTGPIDPAARGAGARRVATGDELETAIHAVEHELLPEAIRLIADGQGQDRRRATRALVAIDER